MKALAIGFRFDESSGEIHTWSIECKVGETAQEIANKLTNDLDNYPPEQILIIVNNHESPSVINHYNLNEHYQ